MNKTVSGLCFAAALGLTATLAAQSATTSQPATTTADKAEHDMTVTGCLAKGAAGGYTLTNARVEPAVAGTAPGSTSTTTAAGSTSTTAATASTTTAGNATTTAGATGTTGGSAANTPGMTWMVSGNNDLEKHLGHRIRVTGKTSWTGGMDRSRTSTTATSTSTTAATGTTAAGSASDQPRLDVKSIKMLSSSCS
jgi:hypothetical protein